MKKQLSKQSVNSPFGGFRGLLATLLFPLWGLGGFGFGFGFDLSAQVSVSNMATTYTANNNKISFTVTWTTQPHNNQIWVITDYIKVAGTATTGSWSRAMVTAVTKNSGTGSVATVSGNRGFWLTTSGSSGSANVTATLSLAAGVDKFNWCAYALNTPPKAILIAGGGYELKGTPPFVVNGSALGAGVKTFGAGTCILSLTDATDNPTSILPAAPTVSTSNPAAICGPGAVTLTATAGGGTTTANTYTWVVDGGAAQTTSTGSLALASVAVGSRTYSVTVTNANNCTSAEATGTVTVHTAVAQASITGATSNTCPATTVSLSASATGATSYTWDKDGSSVQTGTSSVYTVTASGSYTVQAKNDHCTGTTSMLKNIKIIECNNVPGCTGFILLQTTSQYDGYKNRQDAVDDCATKGGRLPTDAEMVCICQNKDKILPPGLIGTYWTSRPPKDQYSCWVVLPNDCEDGWAGDCASNRQYRCVK